MKVYIRRAIYPDIPKLAGIKQLARGESDDPENAMFCAELRYLTEFLDKRESVFVQLADKAPIAFCTARECNRKPFAGCVYIKDLYVLPRWQGRGYGQKLLTYALRTMRDAGYTKAVLETAADNTKARRFYEKSGFAMWDNRGQGGSVYVTYMIDL